MRYILNSHPACISAAFTRHPFVNGASLFTSCIFQSCPEKMKIILEIRTRHSIEVCISRRSVLCHTVIHSRDNDTFQFLITQIAVIQGVSIACNVEPCISYGRIVRPSIRPPVCPTQARITKSSPTDSPMTLVLAVKSSSRNSKGFTPSEGVK